MMSKFLGYKEKRHHVQGNKRSIKCAYREKRCKVIVLCMHIDYLLPTGNKNNWKWKHILFSTLYTFRSTFWNLNCHLEWQHLSHFRKLWKLNILQKVATSCSRLLITFKYNNYIRGKKPISAERKMDVMETQEKGNSNSPFRNFDKFFLYINTKSQHLSLGI